MSGVTLERAAFRAFLAAQWPDALALCGHAGRCWFARFLDDAGYHAAMVDYDSVRFYRSLEGVGEPYHIEPHPDWLVTFVERHDAAIHGVMAAGDALAILDAIEADDGGARRAVGMETA